DRGARQADHVPAHPAERPAAHLCPRGDRHRRDHPPRVRAQLPRAWDRPADAVVGEHAHECRLVLRACLVARGVPRGHDLPDRALPLSHRRRPARRARPPPEDALARMRRASVALALLLASCAVAPLSTPAPSSVQTGGSRSYAMLFDDPPQIVRVSAVDARTVRFDLRTAFGPFLAHLAGPQTAIARGTAGTGPFLAKPDALAPDGTLTLQRNDAYRHK